MTFFSKTTGTFLLFLICFAEMAQARPEYATKEKLNCISCHASPWGGGPRTIMGKTYGTRGLGKSLTIGQDVFYGDLRTISYFPFQDAVTGTNGVALMEA